MLSQIVHWSSDSASKALVISASLRAPQVPVVPGSAGRCLRVAEVMANIFDLPPPIYVAARPIDPTPLYWNYQWMQRFSWVFSSLAGISPARRPPRCGPQHATPASLRTRGQPRAQTATPGWACLPSASRRAATSRERPATPCSYFEWGLGAGQRS